VATHLKDITARLNLCPDSGEGAEEGTLLGVSRGVAGAVVGVAVPLILLQGRGEAEVAATKGGFLSRIQLFTLTQYRSGL
jgi:hypothetical protein